MGEVFRATRLADGAQVALKVPRPDGLDAGALSKRLANESALLAGLNHPGIARFLDAGEVDGIAFVATEFVAGRDLLVWARDAQPSASEILAVAERLAEALAVCHARGVVHRDLSPDNVIVDAEGRPILVDFGLGVELAGGQPYSNLTRSGHVPGKAGYLPPEEQAVDGQRIPADRRFDVHAFGGCL